MCIRFTRRCVPGKYRMPLITGKEMFTLEADEQQVRKQVNHTVSNAYLGQAVDKLGCYEELGEPEEIAEKLARLDKLEKREV